MLSLHSRENWQKKKHTLNGRPETRHTLSLSPSASVRPGSEPFFLGWLPHSVHGDARHRPKNRHELGLLAASHLFTGGFLWSRKVFHWTMGYLRRLLNVCSTRPSQGASLWIGTTIFPSIERQDEASTPSHWTCDLPNQ